MNVINFAQSLGTGRYGHPWDNDRQTPSYNLSEIKENEVTCPPYERFEDPLTGQYLYKLKRE